MMRLVKRICLISLSLFFLVTVAAALYLWHYAYYEAEPILYPSNPIYAELDPEPEPLEGVDYQPFDFVGAEGHSLPALILTPARMGEDQRVDLLRKEGLSGLAELDFVILSVEWDRGRRSALPLAQQLLAKGLRCVVWDSRADGNAQSYCSHGLNESKDLPLLLNALEKQTGKKDLQVLAVGQGYGAGLLLQSLSSEKRFAGVIAIDSFASLSESLSRSLSSSTLIKKAQLWLIDRQLESKMGYESFDVAPVETVALMSRRTPLLLINLAQNSAVAQLDDALQIYRQAKSDDKDIWTLRSAKQDAPDAVTRKITVSVKRDNKPNEISFTINLLNDDAELVSRMLQWMSEAFLRRKNKENSPILLP